MAETVALYAEESLLQSAVRLQNVSKIFTDVAALRDVSAEFRPGRLYVLLGENGAGKSTLLRVIAGLTRPTRGSVEVLEAASLAQCRSRIGYMGHASMLYDELTARENLRFFARLYDVIAQDAVDSAIRLVGLDPALQRPVGTYSQGMRQRLSLARAMVHRPELLLLDEPFSNLDREASGGMTTLLRDLRNSGRTILLVTHQPSLLDGVADEFVTLTEGKVADRSPRRTGTVS